MSEKYNPTFLPGDEEFRYPFLLRCGMDGTSGPYGKNLEEAAKLLREHPEQDLLKARDDQSRKSALEIAVNGKDYDIVAMLVEQKANVNAVNPKNKMAPIHYSAKTGDLKMVEFLLDHNANIDIVTGPRSAWTPLHFACGWNHIELIDLLFRRNASIDITSSPDLDWLGKAQKVPKLAVQLAEEEKTLQAYLAHLPPLSGLDAEFHEGSDFKIGTRVQVKSKHALQRIISDTKIELGYYVNQCFHTGYEGAGELGVVKKIKPTYIQVHIDSTGLTRTYSSEMLIIVVEPPSVESLSVSSE